jgi:membrane protease YdiL (CAAX protease family)
MATRADQSIASSGVPTTSKGTQAMLVVYCLCAGVAPLAARWITVDVVRVATGVVLDVILLALNGYARNEPSLRQYWALPFAFFVLACVQVLNNTIPGFVGTTLLHAPPNAGNPLSSTVPGTVVVQLVGMLVAILPIILLTKVAGRDLGSIYVRRGKLGGWLGFAIVFFVIIYLFIATLPLRPDSPVHRLLPANGALTFERVLFLSPALLVVVLSNAFEEELLFRGLFLQQFNLFFGAGVANVLQAVIFSIAHAGVTYTPSALLFIVAVVFPFGLFAGYLMHSTKSVIVPSIVHAGLDIAIYVAFLSYAA